MAQPRHNDTGVGMHERRTAMVKTLDRYIRRTESASRYVKKALIITDDRQAHLLCDCGTSVHVTGAVNACPKCLTTYSGRGFVIEGSY